MLQLSDQGLLQLRSTINTGRGPMQSSFVECLVVFSLRNQTFPAKPIVILDKDKQLLTSVFRDYITKEGKRDKPKLTELRRLTSKERYISLQLMMLQGLVGYDRVVQNAKELQAFIKYHGANSVSKLLSFYFKWTNHHHYQILAMFINVASLQTSHVVYALSPMQRREIDFNKFSNLNQPLSSDKPPENWPNQLLSYSSISVRLREAWNTKFLTYPVHVSLT
jgi:hypothetical protein